MAPYTVPPEDQTRRSTDYFSWTKTILKGLQYLVVGLASAITPVAAMFLEDEAKVRPLLEAAGLSPVVILAAVPLLAALGAMLNNYNKNKDKPKKDEL
jgi:hypothetical protein